MLAHKKSRYHCHVDVLVQMDLSQYLNIMLRNTSSHFPNNRFVIESKAVDAAHQYYQRRPY